MGFCSSNLKSSESPARRGSVGRCFDSLRNSHHPCRRETPIFAIIFLRIKRWRIRHNFPNCKTGNPVPFEQSSGHWFVWFSPLQKRFAPTHMLGKDPQIQTAWLIPGHPAGVCQGQLWRLLRKAQFCVQQDSTRHRHPTHAASSEC